MKRQQKAGYYLKSHVPKRLMDAYYYLKVPDGKLIFFFQIICQQFHHIVAFRHKERMAGKHHQLIQCINRCYQIPDTASFSAIKVQTVSQHQKQADKKRQNTCPAQDIW